MLKFLDNKKDKIIAIILTFMILYYLTLRYVERITELMLKVTPFPLTYDFVPAEYGVLIIAVLILSIISMVVSLIKKRTIVGCLKILGMGLATSVVLFCGYYIQCQFTINQLNTLEPDSITICSKGNNEGYKKSIQIHNGSREWGQILRLVHELEPISVNEQKRLKEANRGIKKQAYIAVLVEYFNGDDMQREIVIGENDLFIEGGHNAMDRIFVKENDIRRLAEKIIAEN